MSRANLKVAKKLKPQEAELFIEIDEDGVKADYDYVWPDDVSPEDIGSIKSWRMEKARSNLKKATAGEVDMVLDMSTSGDYLDYDIVPYYTLVENRGKVPKPSATQNYQLYYQNRAEQLVIEPNEDGGAELTSTQQIENVVNNVHLKNLMKSPENESGGFSLGNLSMYHIAMIVVGLVIALSFGGVI